MPVNRKYILVKIYGPGDWEEIHQLLAKDVEEAKKKAREEGFIEDVDYDDVFRHVMDMDMFFQN